jgi:hypothetical protein
MIIIACVANNRGNTSRLTRGFDYQARLCGYDEGVQNASYLFWCRSYAESTGVGEPLALNVEDATCVSKCPMANDLTKISCLRDTIIRGFPETGGPAGVLKSYLIHAEQSKVRTFPYDTELFAGRYCMPVNIPLRASLLGPRGPVNLPSRIIKGFGSFQRYPVWLVLFFASFCAVLLGYIYIFMIKFAGKYVLYGTLLLASLAFFSAGCFFLWGIFSFPMVDCQASPTNTWCKIQDAVNVGIDSNYQKYNPIFQRNTPWAAVVISSSAGVLLLFASIVSMTHFANTESHYNSISDLIQLSYDCVFSMKDMLFPPIFEALWKYFLTLILMKNFMSMLTVGDIDARRIVVNGVHYEGASKMFYYDWWFLPWMLFYVCGCIWIMELCNAFGQFVCSYCVVSWYYIKTIKGEDGKKRKVSARDHNPAFMAIYQGVRYHLGSLFLGSFIISIYRIPRVVRELVCVQLMRDSSCPGPLKLCDCFCKCLQAAVCKPCQVLHCFDDKEHTEGLFAKYNKNAYIDIIIRANHFWPSAERAFNIFGIHKACQNNMGCLKTVTLIGVSSIGILCGTITYNMLGIDMMDNPDSLYYVQDPLFVSFVASCLCGNIAYSFVQLIDNTNDTILYCYCHNRKFKKESIDDYIPEELRVIVGSDDKNPDVYPYYGKAPPSMYLSSWMNIKKAPPERPPARDPSALTATDYGYGFNQTQPQSSQSGAWVPPQGDPSLAREYSSGLNAGGNYGGYNTGYRDPAQQPLTSNMR